MDWQSVVRSRRAIAVSLCLLVGSVAGVAFVGANGIPGEDRLPAWDRVYPSLELDEGTTETLVREKVNDARAGSNLTRLSRDDTLSAVARNHSRDMAERGFFNHTTPDGVGPSQRVDRAGVACQAVSENIIRLPRQNHEEPLAETAVESWLESAGHLMNIVAENWSRTGVGVVADEDTVYITQVFCS
jgi:uncharacterized protein YkwD